MNRILLSGFIGKDAEVSTFDWGEVMRFTLATTETWLKDGEKKSATTWHNIERTGKNLENLAKHLKSGVAVEVVGKQEHRKVDDKYFSSVRADEIKFCPAKKQSESSGQNNENTSPDEEDTDLPF